MPTVRSDGVRTYGNLTFLPDPDCEKFAFDQPGMATSRAELRYMFSQPGSLGDGPARPAAVLTSLERAELEHQAYENWLAEIDAFNAGNAPHPESLAVKSSPVIKDDEPGLVLPFRKRQQPTPPSV